MEKYQVWGSIYQVFGFGYRASSYCLCANTCSLIAIHYSLRLIHKFNFWFYTPGSFITFGLNYLQILSNPKNA
jgi:hypothetical protein